MKVFSGTANVELSKQICDNLKIPLGEILHKTFASGELYCQYKTNIRGKDVFLINPIQYPANDCLMQLLLMADAARRASAGRITAVIPYFGYARQDRKNKPRVPISAKLIMDLIAASGFNRVITMDLHAAQIGGFTNLPFDHLSFKPSLMTSIKQNKISIDCVVAPDVGSIKRATEYSKALNKSLAIVIKERLGDTEVKTQNFIGDVKNKKVIIIDDLTESVGTLVEAAKTCKEMGASEINIAVTHGCFSEKGVYNMGISIEDSLFKRFFYSNTVCIKDNSDVLSYQDIIKVDVAPVFAKAISRVHNNESVSELFEIES